MLESSRTLELKSLSFFFFVFIFLIFVQLLLRISPNCLLYGRSRAQKVGFSKGKCSWRWCNINTACLGQIARTNPNTTETSRDKIKSDVVPV